MAPKKKSLKWAPPTANKATRLNDLEGAIPEDVAYDPSLELPDQINEPS